MKLTELRLWDSDFLGLTLTYADGSKVRHQNVPPYLRDYIERLCVRHTLPKRDGGIQSAICAVSCVARRVEAERSRFAWLD